MRTFTVSEKTKEAKHINAETVTATSVKMAGKKYATQHGLVTGTLKVVGNGFDLNYSVYSNYTF